MKTIKFYLKSIAIIILIKTGELNAQITNLSHAGGLGDYIGWQFNTSLDLDIVNEDPQRINFYTDAGSSTLNNLRMVIAGNGNVGVGDNTTPLSLFHLHQSGVGTSSLFHITNAGTGTALTEGFDIVQQNAGPVFFNQNELDFIRFQSLSNGGVIGGATLRKRIDISTYNQI